MLGVVCDPHSFAPHVLKKSVSRGGNCKQHYVFAQVFIGSKGSGRVSRWVYLCAVVFSRLVYVGCALTGTSWALDALNELHHNSINCRHVCPDPAGSSPSYICTCSGFAHMLASAPVLLPSGCLSLVGWVFTVLSTYSGFALMLASVLLGANIPSQLSRAWARSTTSGPGGVSRA